MKNVKSKFAEEHLKILAGLGVVLLDEHDYSDEELMDIHDQITEAYLDQGFDENGDPTPEAGRYEALIDFFCDELGI